MRQVITEVDRDKFTKIHSKLVADKPLSDEEVDQGLWFFEDLELRLRCLGPSHTLSARECGRLRDRLEAFQRARENSSLGLRRDAGGVNQETVCISDSPTVVKLSSLPYTMQKLAMVELEYSKLDYDEDTPVRSAMRFIMPYAIQVGLVLEKPKFWIVPIEHTCVNGMYMPNKLSVDFNPTITDVLSKLCVVNTDYGCCIDDECGSRALYRSIREAVDDVISLIGLGNESSVCR